MMNATRNWLLPAVAACAIVLLAIPVRAQPPATVPAAPPNFDYTGSVDMLDLDNGKMSVGDTTLLVSPKTPVVLLSGKVTTAEALQKGTKVGYTSVSTGKGRPTVTRIWVLPNDYAPPNN